MRRLAVSLAQAAAALFASLSLMTSPAAAQDAAPAEPVVVELFTSQGCANCPKANAFLGKLAESPKVIALTYAVGYWDYLGWRDTFAKAEFTTRQKIYAKRMHQGRVYTPEMVVNGAAHASGSKSKDVVALIRQPHSASAQIKIESSAIEVRGPMPAQTADVWLVEYTPGPMFVQVTKGENAGVNMPHYNLVTKLRKLGEWSGGEARFKGVCAKNCVVIVQREDGGAVLGAARGG
jgi:hypothetical protein